MTARTVKVSGSAPLQSEAIRGCRGFSKTWKKYTSAKPNAKMRKHKWHAKPNECLRNSSVVNCEDTAVLRSSRPRSPLGILASAYQVPRLLWQTG
eukprot:6187174-Pleurochrysis_carterae.AAC.1